MAFEKTEQPELAIFYLTKYCLFLYHRFMPHAFSGNAAFWRACCLVVAAIAALEALGLVFVAHTSLAPPLTISSNTTQILPTTVPDAMVATPAVSGEESAHTRRRASSRAKALAAEDPLHRARAWEDRGISLAENDPGAALSALAELAPGADRNAMARGIFEGLARGDAAQAIAYAKQTRPGPERDAALTALLDGWNGPGGEGSLSGRAHRIGSDGLEAGLGEELSNSRPDLAVLWAQELTSGKGKAELLGDAAATQVRKDPALAASYGDGLTGADQILFNVHLVSSWAQVQPEAAWEWSSALADPAIREQAQNVAVVTQATSDLPGAIARLALLPDDDQRANTLRQIAYKYANVNTDAATAWAQTLPPADGTVANEAIGAAAPVGVGLSLSAAAGGDLIVQDVVPNAGAAQSGSIHQGDRIVAVSQGNDQFVPVQQLDLQKAVGLVRGSAGSLVQLQILPALPEGGYGPPTVVSIVRQQVKHGG